MTDTHEHYPHRREHINTRTISPPLCVALILGLAAPAAAAQQTADGGGVRFHFAGYADATYVDTRGEGGQLAVTFAPIFHLQFGERVLLEAEIESEADSDGESEIALEYAAVNVLLGDNAALVVGKFLSPTGYFFQNQHPSWINKLASAPAGFGHGGAATLTEVGVQLRGGKTFVGGQHLNYAAYVGNGPRLGLEGMDDLDLDAEGSSTNRDGKRVAGGRLGWMPRAGLELGASLARGGVRLGGTGTDPMDLSLEPSRSYRVDGMDAAWRVSKALEFRGEWIRQRVGAAQASAVPMGATWRAWYAQGAYRFGGDRWEAVTRYGQSRSPHGEATFDQFALGLNRLITHNSQLKLAWEFNDSDDATADADRVLLQIAYGF